MLCARFARFVDRVRIQGGYCSCSSPTPACFSSALSPCVNREAVNSLAPTSRSLVFQSGDSLRSKRKGHGGKKRHWKQNEFGLHSKSVEESRTGITQGWPHNDGILEATRQVKLGEIVFIFYRAKKKNKHSRGYF